ncbi:hypothetical protein NL676_031640 [Syzygium grande]|nr:hypothetical protein NL676_031640 [Syzygium grande]
MATSSPSSPRPPPQSRASLSTRRRQCPRSPMWLANAAATAPPLLPLLLLRLSSGSPQEAPAVPLPSLARPLVEAPDQPNHPSSSSS